MPLRQDEVPQLTDATAQEPRRRVVYDVTRLVTRALNPAPNGIDRVDFALARHFLERREEERGALVCTAIGPRLADPAKALKTIESVEAHWREESDAQEDSVYRAAVASLRAQGGDANVSARARKAPSFAALSRNVEALRRWAPHLGRPLRTLPQGVVYFNATLFLIDRPWYVGWLASRPDVAPVFFIHDLLPIDAPEFFRSREALLHPARMRHVCRYGAGAVVASKSVARRLMQFAADNGRHDFPICVAPLPAAPVFSKSVAAPAELDGLSYFVVCGTIEPRKNHILLINVWRELAREAKPPKLVIVGKRGWLNAPVVDALEGDDALRPHVVEAGGLSTPGLRRLLAGARALLTPSLGEGFGLPVVEALAAGTPVIVSDIEAFREIGGAAPDYLDPLDGSGWLQAVRDFSAPQSPRRDAALLRLKQWSGADAGGYFATIDDFLARLPRRA
ncbi:glycosyltransferase family 1 protein [Methylocystis sp. 9N]|uniref:Glycosyltransferase family 1 protein n=1 Tax=Methylocystis borbori TaxID=3118750 RepID=A0ABU7XFW1_9HYPH